jgi:hypothetical protein
LPPQSEQWGERKELTPKETFILAMGLIFKALKILSPPDTGGTAEDYTDCFLVIHRMLKFVVLCHKVREKGRNSAGIEIA